MKYTIELESPDYSFHATHFVAFPQRGAEDGAPWYGEPPHEHDFFVSARLSCPLDASDCVVDFIAARRALLDVLARWNNRFLVATNMPCVSYVEKPTEDALEIQWKGAPSRATYTTPLSRVFWINASNASAEIVAGLILVEWLESLPIDFAPGVYSATLRLEEALGFFAEASL